MAIQSQMQNPNPDMQNPNPNYYHLQHHHLQQQFGGSDNVKGDLFPVLDWMAGMQQNVVYGVGDGRVQNQNVGFGQLRSDNHQIDSYINFQSEKLRQVVQAQRKMELSWLAKKFETMTSALVKQKDEQIWQLTLRTMELERLRSTLQLENESLQATSRQNQATIQSLNQAIELLRGVNEVDSHLAEDVGSCCDAADATRLEFGRDGGVGVNGGGGGGGESPGMRVICGGCDLREASVVFLPCRHLCVCDVCEDDFRFCPICKKEKSSSIMTLVF